MKNLFLIIILIFVGCKAAEKGGDKSYFDKNHTPFQELPAKVTFKTVDHTASTVTLVWGNSLAADSYTIKFKVHNSSTWSTLTTNASSPYVVSNLSTNTLYDFFIIAKNQVGEISSDMITTSTLTSLDAPVASTVSVASFNEGVQEIIDLPYAISTGDFATSCEIMNLVKAHVTRSCQCDVAGDCSVGITSDNQTYGAGSFDYRIFVNSLASGYETVSFNILPVNDAPSIGAIAAVTASEDALVTVNFTISDPDSILLCNSSFLSATSSNAALIPVSGITFSGTAPSCRATFTPSRDLSGTSTLAFTVTDGALSATSNSFTATINAVNDSPVIGSISTVATDANQAAVVNFTVSDVDSGINCNNASITSTNNALVDASRVVFSGTAPACIMTITPKLNQYGQAQVTLNVTDGTATSQSTFTINVAQVNIAPSISFISNASTQEGTAAIVNFTINDIDSVLGCNASHLSMASSNTTLVLGTDVTFSGTVPNCVATIRPLANKFGSTNLTFTVTDGALSSSSNAFSLAVAFVDDAPTISAIMTPQITNQDTAKVVGFTIDDIDTTTLSCANVTGTSSNTTILANNNIVIGGTFPTCTATMSPTAGKSGTVNVTLTVNDGTSGNSTTFSLIVNAVNAQPSISALSNVATSEDTASVVGFTINDPDSVITCSASHLSAASSNPTVVLSTDIVFSGNYPNCFATINPLADVSGSSNITFTVTDGTLSLTSNPFTLSVAAVNDAPFITSILTPQVTNQDTTKDVHFTVTDIDSTIVCSTAVTGASSDTNIVPNSGITIDGTYPDCVAHITPSAGKNGPVNISLTVSDTLLSNTSSFSLVIVAVNAAPTISGLTNATLAEDTPTTLSFTINDVDSPLACTSANLSATSSVTSLVPLSGIVFSGTAPSCKATITPAADQYGTTDVVIKVTDGTITVPSAAVTLTVTAVNDAPSIAAVSSQSMTQDVAKVINFTINDVDGGLVCSTAVTGTSSNTGIIANAGIVIGGAYPNCTATVTPLAGKNGSVNISLTVDDGTATVVTTFPVAIAAVNAAPTISGLVGTTVNEDAPATINFTINDVDSPLACTSSYLSATSSNPSLVLSTDVVFNGTYPNCSATITPLANQFGSTNVTIALTDGTLSTVGGPIIITVNSVNDAPTISSVASQSMNQDIVKSVNFKINDVDSVINCSNVTGVSSNTAIVPNANIFISGTYPDCTAAVTPLATKNGSLNISLVVSDGSLTNTSTFSLAIAAVNIPPTLSNVVVPVMTEDTPGTISFTITDPDSTLDCISAFISASSTNSALIDPTAVVIGGSYPACTATFTPVANQNGTATVKIIVSDGTVSTTSSALTLNVAAVNDAPVVAPISTQNLLLNQSGSVNVNISDVDSTLSCSSSITASSSNTALVPVSAITFSGTVPNCVAAMSPLHNISGSTNITLSVSDGTTATPVTFAVTFGSTYIPPVAANLSPASISEDMQGMITLSYTNVQSDLATSCYVGTTNHVTVTTPCSCDVAGVCTVGVTGASNYNGSAGFTYNVTANSTASNNATASFTIMAVNDAPVMGTVLSQSTNEDTAKVVNFTVSDIDSTLTCSGSVSATSSDTTIVANTGIVIGGSIPNCTATITPIANQNGTTNITLVATDGSLTAQTLFALTVAAVNDAPVMGAISSQATNEDTLLEVDFTINEIDSTLSCMGNVTGSSSNTAIIANSDIVIIGNYPNCKARVTPRPNATGSASITLTVNDGSLSDSKTFSLAVAAVNDAPIISSIAAQSTNEDIAKAVSFTINDIDSTLTCAGSVTGSSSNSALVASGNISITGTAPNCVATVTPIANQNGSADITLTVTDGSLGDTSNFTMTVNPVNDAPVLSTIAAQTTSEDTAKVISFTLTDIDSTIDCSTSVTATSSNDAIVLGSAVTFGGTGSNCTATVNPQPNQNGVVSLTFTATDGALTAVQTFNFTTTAVNDAPTISTISSQATDEDTAKAVNFTINDVDSTLTCSGSVTKTSSDTTMVPANNIVISGTAPNCVATITPGVDQSGTANITLMVSDGSLTSVSSFAFMINPINDAPVMGAIATQATNEDISKLVNFTITDSDSVISCTGSVVATSSNPTLVTSSDIVFGGAYPNCTATIFPEADLSGVTTLTFTVSDGALSGSQSFNLTVNAVNDAPVINSISAQSTAEDTAKGVNFTISDVDSSLTCSGSVTATSANTTLIPTNNIVISGTAPACVATVTPGADQNGTGNITLTVTDGSLTSQSTFAMTVTAVNDAPTMGAIAAQATNEDTSKVVNFTVNDIDSTITCSGSVTAATSDATLVATSDVVFGGTYPNCTATISPEANASGAVNLTFTVSDGALTATQTFALTVNAVNDAPLISSITAQITDEDTAKAVNFTISDIDSTLTCAGSVTATSNNTSLVGAANVVITGTGLNCTATINPLANQSGSAVITLTVSDGQLTRSSAFALTVNAVNDAPTISFITNDSFDEDNSKIINFTINDVDSTLACNSSSLSVTSSNASVILSTDIVFAGTYPNCTATISPLANQNGASNLIISVTDGALTTASNTFILTVNAVNDAPTMSTIAAQSTNEDTAKGVNFTINDIDSSLTCSGSVTGTSSDTSIVPNASITVAGNYPNCTATILPAANKNGAVNITLTVSDGQLSTGTTFALTIVPVNDAPTISNIAAQSTNEDTAVAVNFTINDVDSVLTCSGRVSGTSNNTAIVGSSNVVVTGTYPNCTATISPVANANGAVNVTLTVTDGSLSATSVFALTVVAVDDAPVSTNIATTTLTEDVQTIITLPYTDIESDQATACFVTGLSNVTITQACGCTAGVCTVGVTGTTNYNGVAGFSFNVTANGAVSNTSTAALTITAVNDAPTISTISTQTTNEDTSTVVNFTIADVDSTLTCAGSVSKSSSNTTIVPNSYITIAGTFPNCTATILPALNQNGAVNITLTVTDGALTNSSIFALNITPVDDAPVASNISSLIINEDAQAIVTLPYIDVDGDQASACTLSSLSHITVTTPCSCTLGVCTAGITGTADYNGVAGFSFTVTSNSVVSNTATASFTINAVNDAPTMAAISAQSTLEDTSVAVNFTITDIDSTLTCVGSVTGTSSVTGTVSNANIVITGTAPNCTATISPTANQNGAVNITLTVSDTLLTAAKTFALTIQPVLDISGSLTLSGVADTTYGRTLSFANITVDEAVSKAEVCISEDTNLNGIISAGEKCNTQTWIDITSVLGASGSTTPASWPNYAITNGVNGASFTQALAASCSSNRVYFTHLRLTNSGSNTTELASVSWKFWNPSCIPSLIGGWLDASDYNTLFSTTSCTGAVTSGTAAGVKCWKDKSPSALEFKGTGVGFPKYVSNAWSGSKPAVVFNGNQDIYTASSINPKNFFAALKVLANENNDVLIGNMGTDFGVRINGSGSWYTSTTSYGTSDFTYAGGSSFVNGTSGAAHGLQEHVLYESKGNWGLPLGGTWPSVQIGGSALVGGRIEANIGEMIICTTDCSASQTKLEGYLAHKWGLVGSLPAAHPYKTTPP